jgi:hypothetical protein
MRDKYYFLFYNQVQKCFVAVRDLKRTSAESKLQNNFNHSKFLYMRKSKSRNDFNFPIYPYTLPFPKQQINIFDRSI